MSCSVSATPIIFMIAQPLYIIILCLSVSYISIHAYTQHGEALFGFVCLHPDFLLSTRVDYSIAICFEHVQTLYPVSGGAGELASIIRRPQALDRSS